MREAFQKITCGREHWNPRFKKLLLKSSKKVAHRSLPNAGTTTILTDCGRTEHYDFDVMEIGGNPSREKLGYLVPDSRVLRDYLRDGNFEVFDRIHPNYAGNNV
eukprot:scaffold72280_cov54-Attheya_sp.AAC.1